METKDLPDFQNEMCFQQGATQSVKCDDCDKISYYPLNRYGELPCRFCKKSLGYLL